MIIPHFIVVHYSKYYLLLLAMLMVSSSAHPVSNTFFCPAKSKDVVFSNLIQRMSQGKQGK
jgi:hypothetical protein